ncbi:MAG: phospholipase D-like domain-containing protein [bacterium]|nr:phospholipase D-like domain-containing protein [bacterium]
MKKRSPLKRKNSYNWREGNSFKLLKNGDLFLPRMFEAIEYSNDYILLEMYLVQTGELIRRFVDALCLAAERGVSVYILLDGYGAAGLAMDERERLEKSGARLSYFNPLRYWKWRSNLHRDHRKLLIVDGKVAFTGGLGIADDFSPEHAGPEFWRETMVEIAGPVVSDWHDSFRHLWLKCSKTNLKVKAMENAVIPSGQIGRVTLSGHAKKEVFRSLIKQVRSGRHRVWLTTAYFIPTWKIRRALRKAVRAGCDVRILVPGPITDHQSVRRIGHIYYQSLLRNGIRIFEYQPGFLHAKLLICDDWVSVGSSNLDRWSMRWNLEANQEVADKGFADDAARLFVEDLEESEEILYAAWLKRPSRHRWMESFYGWGMLWIEYFAYLKRFRLSGSSRLNIKSHLPRWLGKYF